MIFRIVLFNQGKPEIFSAEITQKNYLIAKKKLELTYKEIVSKLKDYQVEGKIKSIWRPKNKQMQKELDDLVKTKHIIKDTLKKMRLFFT